jgi:hypothetical protein
MVVHIHCLSSMGSGRIFVRDIILMHRSRARCNVRPAYKILLGLS